jgi:hypothetical protein
MREAVTSHSLTLEGRSETKWSTLFRDVMEPMMKVSQGNIMQIAFSPSLLNAIKIWIQ